MESTALADHVKSKLETFISRWWARWKTDWLREEPFDWRALVTILVGAVVLFPLTSRLPMLGWEWPLHLGGMFDDTYPPWLQLALKPLSILPIRTGLSLLYGAFMIAIAMLTVRAAADQSRLSKFAAAALALATPVVPILLWEGNMVMVVMVGMAILPVGIPWALVQPHLMTFALLSRRRWTIWAAAFGVVTVLIWGLWPLQTIGLLGGSTSHIIAMGWLPMGWPVLVIGLFMLPFTHAHPYRLMAVGTFLLPYVMAVHMVLLLPAIGEVKGWRRVLLFGAAWLILITPAFAVLWAKYVTMIFPFAVWWMLRPQNTHTVQETKSG